MADDKSTPIPPSVQAAMKSGLRQRFALGTQGLKKGDEKK